MGITSFLYFSAKEKRKNLRPTAVGTKAGKPVTRGTTQIRTPLRTVWGRCLNTPLTQAARCRLSTAQRTAWEHGTQELSANAPSLENAANPLFPLHRLLKNKIIISALLGDVNRLGKISCLTGLESVSWERFRSGSDIFGNTPRPFEAEYLGCPAIPPESALWSNEISGPF